MKLLMTTDAVGGVWTYALDLAKALATHDVEVALATMGPLPSDDQRAAARRLSNVTLHESSFKLEWMDNPWDDITAAGRWLLDLEEQIRPDIVHLNSYAHAALPFAAPIVVVAHSCVVSWWRAVKGEPAPPAWDRYRQAVSHGLHDADVVVAPSAAMLGAIEENYGDLRRFRVIHNGRDHTLYRRGVKESFVLAAGRLWDEAKNIKALEMIAKDLAWPICVAGEGPTNEGGDVLALGKLTPVALAEWLARAAIYALPARYEPFGLSVLEAALSGCALVLGDIPSLREIWADSAIYIPPNDPRQIRDALQSLIKDEGRRIEFARRARAHAARYSLAMMGDSYAALYRSVLRAHQAIDAGTFDPWPTPQLGV